MTIKIYSPQPVTVTEHSANPFGMPSFVETAVPQPFASSESTFKVETPYLPSNGYGLRDVPAVPLSSCDGTMQVSPKGFDSQPGAVPFKLEK